MRYEETQSVEEAMIVAYKTIGGTVNNNEDLKSYQICKQWDKQQES